MLVTVERRNAAHPCSTNVVYLLHACVWAKLNFCLKPDTLCELGQPELAAVLHGVDYYY